LKMFFGKLSTYYNKEIQMFDLVLTGLMLLSVLYLAHFAYSLVSIKARVRARGPSLARMEHEKRMLKRRQDRGYRV